MGLCEFMLMECPGLPLGRVKSFIPTDATLCIICSPLVEGLRNESGDTLGSLRHNTTAACYYAPSEGTRSMWKCPDNSPEGSFYI